MKKMIVMIMLVVGVSSVASAIQSAHVPEIDPGSGMSALVLLSGAVMLFRGRRKQ